MAKGQNKTMYSKCGMVTLTNISSWGSIITSMSTISVVEGTSWA